MNLLEKNKTISDTRKKELLAFQAKLGLSFSSLELFNLSLTHTSYANENIVLSKELMDNERLEFLGDAVLELIITEYLYETKRFSKEGDLAKLRAAIVCEQSLAQAALEIELQDFLLLGRGEEKSGGREKKALLADSFEALIGAIYLDSGIAKAKKFVLSFMKTNIEQILIEKKGIDYKTLLQEFAQKTYKTIPKYNLVSESGPDHDKSFFISVLLADKTFGPLEGKNKKEAEQAVAKSACHYFKLIS